MTLTIAAIQDRGAVPVVAKAPLPPKLPRAVMGVLGVQWAALCGWTWWVYSSWNVHVDFASRAQAAFGILHGNLNPFYTIMGWSHLADHFDLSMYPAALLTSLWPHLFWLFIVQVTLLIAAEGGALRLLDLGVRQPWWPATIGRNVALGVLASMFFLNPFIAWGVASDLHFHMYGAVCGMVFVALFFFQGAWKKMVMASLFALAFGDMGAQLLVILGVSLGIVSLRSTVRLRVSGLLVMVGVAWWAVTAVGGGSAGSELGLHYGYLAGTSAAQVPLGHVVAGLTLHPSAALRRIPSALSSMWGPLSIGGILGLFSPLSLPILLNGTEAGLGVQTWVGWPVTSMGSMAEMPWQMLPLLIAEPLLTIILLAWLQRPTARLRRPLNRVTPVVLVVLVVNALAWSIVWFPPIFRSINLTPPTAVRALNEVLSEIPPHNEVVASLGTVGRMGDRQFVYLTVFGSADTEIPLRTPTVDFVISPVTGQESNAVDLEYLTSFLLSQPNAHLISRNSNVWFFAYQRQPGQSELSIDYQTVGVSGAALPTPTDTPTTTNWPLQGCLATATNRGIDLVSGYRNALPPGEYLARLSVWNAGKMLVQVGDDDTHHLLAKGWVASGSGLRTVSLPFTVVSSGRIPTAGGWGPYRLSFPIPQQNDMIEMRIWTKGPGATAVCGVSLLARP